MTAKTPQEVVRKRLAKLPGNDPHMIKLASLLDGYAKQIDSRRDYRFDRTDVVLDFAVEFEQHVEAEVTRQKEALLNRLEKDLDGGRTYTSVSLIKETIEAERQALSKKEE